MERIDCKVGKKEGYVFLKWTEELIYSIQKSSLIRKAYALVMDKNTKRVLKVRPEKISFVGDIYV